MGHGIMWNCKRFVTIFAYTNYLCINLKLLSDNERDELEEQDGVVNIHWINSMDGGVFHIVECFGGFKWT